MRAQVGDLVRCMTHEYASLPYMSIRRVLEVIEGPSYGPLIKLKNPKSPYGTSDYKASNFRLYKRETTETIPDMAYEKTKFFAVETDPEKDRIMTDSGDCILHFGGRRTTPLRNLKYETLNDIKDQISAGEKWMVFQTIALVEGEEPKPPIKVTEYR